MLLMAVMSIGLHIMIWRIMTRSICKEEGTELAEAIIKLTIPRRVRELMVSLGSLAALKL
jgi:hypothetical protein